MAEEQYKHAEEQRKERREEGEKKGTWVYAKEGDEGGEVSPAVAALGLR